MYWATTTFKVVSSPDLLGALRDWRDHIREAHRGIAEVRCYRFNAGTDVVWQEGFKDFHDYQALIEEEDDVCEGVMAKVFTHMVPGTREGRIWSDAL
jgi:hypothetical protein